MTRIYVTQKSLLDAVTALVRVVPTRSTNRLLTALRVRVSADTMILTATNGGCRATACLPIEANGEGEFTVPAHLFAETVKRCGGELVTLTLHQDQLTVESAGNSTVLDAGRDWLDVPDVVAVPDEYGTVTGGDLLGAVAGSGGVKAFQEVNRTVTLSDSEILSTDGYQLTRIPATLPGIGRAGVRADAVTLLGKMAGKTGRVTLHPAEPERLRASFQAGKRGGVVAVDVPTVNTILTPEMVAGVTGGDVVARFTVNPDRIGNVTNMVHALAQFAGMPTKKQKTEWHSYVSAILNPDGTVSIRQTHADVRKVVKGKMVDVYTAIDDGPNGTLAGVASNTAIPLGSRLALFSASLELLAAGGEFEVLRVGKMLSLRRVECTSLGRLHQAAYVPTVADIAAALPDPADLIAVQDAVTVAGILSTEPEPVEPEPVEPAPAVMLTGPEPVTPPRADTGTIRLSDTVHIWASHLNGWPVEDVAAAVQGITRTELKALPRGHVMLTSNPLSLNLPTVEIDRRGRACVITPAPDTVEPEPVEPVEPAQSEPAREPAAVTVEPGTLNPEPVEPVTALVEPEPVTVEPEPVTLDTPAAPAVLTVAAGQFRAWVFLALLAGTRTRRAALVPFSDSEMAGGPPDMGTVTATAPAWPGTGNLAPDTATVEPELVTVAESPPAAPPPGSAQQATTPRPPAPPGRPTRPRHQAPARRGRHHGNAPPGIPLDRPLLFAPRSPGVPTCVPHRSQSP